MSSTYESRPISPFKPREYRQHRAEAVGKQQLSCDQLRWYAFRVVSVILVVWYLADGRNCRFRELTGGFAKIWGLHTSPVSSANAVVTRIRLAYADTMPRVEPPEEASALFVGAVGH